MARKWNFQRGWRAHSKKPSVRGVWIFFGPGGAYPTPIQINP